MIFLKFQSKYESLCVEVATQHHAFCYGMFHILNFCMSMENAHHTQQFLLRIISYNLPKPPWFYMRFVSLENEIKPNKAVQQKELNLNPSSASEDEHVQIETDIFFYYITTFLLFYYSKK